MAMNAGSNRSPVVVDGGAVLVARPYNLAQWASVRKAWWWHTAGMVFLFPFYSLIALTMWQVRSGQPFLRRVIWASMLTVGAPLVVGLPPFVLFSRRWYWLWRTRTEPFEAHVPATRPDPQASLFALVAAKGAEFADYLIGQLGKGPSNSHHVPEPAQQTLPDPWATLVAEAVAARDRIRRTTFRSVGPVAETVKAAAGEADAAVGLVSALAQRACSITYVLQTTPKKSLTQRLIDLGEDPSLSSDVEATKVSLREQLASIERLEQKVQNLEERLRRLVTQMGEAAIKAEELTLGVAASDAHLPGLTSTVNDLTALRAAFDSLDTSELEAPPIRPETQTRGGPSEESG